MKFRLIVMNFLEFAVWGAYLTSMGSFLVSVGLEAHIGIFYAMQGIVSIFMPAIMGIVADRWIPAQKLLGICHFLAAAFMAGMAAYALTAGEAISFVPAFALYAVSVAFYMPTLALSNSVAFTALRMHGLDTEKDFPPIRVFGTIGFIVAMLLVNFLRIDAGGGLTLSFTAAEGLTSLQVTPYQFVVSAVFGLLLAGYTFTLPACAVNRGDGGKKSIVEALGLRAFTLFKERRMALFFIFSMLLGVSLQITNGFANPFITSFQNIPEYAGTWGARNANALISLSQVSETLCILLIPFFLKRFGIKSVMLIAMFAWVLRFGFFGLGNPGGGLWLFVLSMIVYGVAFDFFNISGALFVDKETDGNIRSSAQGLFMLMTNGIGATVGTLGAQAVVNHFVYAHDGDLAAQAAGWSTSWFIFAGYALVVAVVFALVFKYRHNPENI